MLLFAVPLSAAKRYSVLVYHGANPPYSYEEEGLTKGLFADIFAYISSITGLQFEFVPLSVARGHRMFEQGKVDIEPGVNPLWRQESSNPGLYSRFYAYSREVVLARSKLIHTMPESLYGQVIGRVRGYRYGAFEQHFGEQKIMPYDNVSERELLAQLAHKRFDYIMIGDITAAYYRHSHAEYRAFQEVYEISCLPVAMRIQPTQPELKAAIDQALEQMIKSGALAAIYSKYGALLRVPD
ncbi:substrate-binding periplasmic protein [Pseudoalteromonas fenneropenaei]|uniref:Substrate-binding periplasmic protein n=1 Tax=Pseudoalteromonas fenneropenaei TaxID=1737459 RepID=A0ABV7CKV8_9GAMM